MEDPAKEVSQVVQLLTAAVSPEVQRAAVLRYYTPDASFRHPVCAVPPSTAPPSRNAVLGIYQWYRVISPRIDLTVRRVLLDPAHPTHLFLQIEQLFHLRWSPLAPAPSHLTVHLTLRPVQEDGGKTLYYIESQEDFYHPDDLVALLVPPLAPLVRCALFLAALQSNIGRHIAAMFGCWSIKPDEGGHRGAAPRPEEAPEAPAAPAPAPAPEEGGVREDQEEGPAPTDKKND
ncbi:hypothetical protein SCP_0803290 [Sparassis crispa]|uniref:SigF-like NTF2-like domain-containing protein n=1 Tax=Sparassis crispa TaxID=139825 RepID=A0A401GUA4_9APHY|nr:hypothetical protein SCP_0803290 [Sparassis crispa]GBE85807.1 hypothetical protein SCP_0803290 [Sparassis crispa]